MRVLDVFCAIDDCMLSFASQLRTMQLAAGVVSASDRASGTQVR